jgi:hypothetical protein
MPYVSGHKHDLFLSYAHAEAAWVEAFRKALREEFHVRTGADIALWQDTRSLRTGQKWEKEIEDGIRSAAAFVAIISPAYLNSPWCRQERAIVLEKELEALKVESIYRFLKVIKTPGPEEPLAELQRIPFFNEADGYELPQGTPEFTARIREIVRHIRELLTLMSNKYQELYLAPGAIDMLSEREELTRELKDRGFTIKPAFLPDSSFGKKAILKAMDNVSHAIFVFGGEYDKFTADQIEAARELGRPAVFWVQPGEDSDKMRRLIDDLGKLPNGSEVLGGRSIREMLPALLEKVKPRETPAPAQPVSGAASVYLNYDTTLPEDTRIAANIAGLVRERNFEVVQRGRDGDHDRLMRAAGAVLLFRAAHPDPDEWLKQNARELAFAGQIYEKNPDFAAKALLVADPARIQALSRGVPAYAYSDPFQPETLTPFFDKLRTAGAAHAG